MSELTAFGSERIYWAVEQVEREAGDIDNLHLDDSFYYLKSEADKEIAHHKYKRCLQYAKNHKHLGDLATDTARLIGLNAYAFTKETETACIAYWNRIRDCHYRHHDEWLELAEKFKEAI